MGTDTRAKIAAGLVLLASITGIVGYTRGVEGDGPSVARGDGALADDGAGQLPTSMKGAHSAGLRASGRVLSCMTRNIA